MNPDATRDVLALVKSDQDVAARDWKDYDRFGEERAAILRHADLVQVCDVLAITVAARWAGSAWTLRRSWMMSAPVWAATRHDPGS